MAPPCAATRSASVGTASACPVTARLCARKSGRPTSCGTSAPFSSSATALPCRVCRAGWQPVAKLADTARVADGKAVRKPGKFSACAAKLGQTRRARRIDEVAAKPIQDDDDGAVHDA